MDPFPIFHPVTVKKTCLRRVVFTFRASQLYETFIMKAVSRSHVSTCCYCRHNGKSKEELYLVCSCKKNIHVECLTRSVPGGLVGDNFFNFTCESCNLGNGEQITRQKLSWFAVIVLALYNLHSRSEGVSKRGYFHWKGHICNFIDKHWNVLFNPSVKKKKSWMGTVSGTLSHFCPSFFLSGSEELKEPGWWRIAHENMTPQQIVEIHTQNQTSKKKCKVQVQFQEIVAIGNTSPSSSGNDESNVGSSYMDFNSSMSETGIVTASESVSSEPDRKCSDIDSVNDDTKFTYPDLFLNEEHLSDMDVDVNDLDLDLGEIDKDGFNLFENFFPSEHSSQSLLSKSNFLSGLPDKTLHIQDQLPVLSLEDLPSKNLSSSNQNTTVGKDNLVDENVKAGTNSKEVPETEAEQVIPQSLFLHTSPEQQKPPWKELEEKDRNMLIVANQAKCVQMSEYEELQLLSQLRQASETRDLPGFAVRLYRKLCVRQLKRQRGLPIFNLDKTFQERKDSLTGNVWMNPSLYSRNHSTTDARILDRFYQVPTKTDKEKQKSCPFKIRLMGCSEPTCFLSPYTQRQLKPYIQRDYETVPQWLKLLSEIKTKANKKIPNWQPPPRYPIDYCYVRPQHISAVNSLCCEFFYPGIDLTETLQYPDFSCVVLYRKLVIAFAFMVPDAGFNETYISFLFTRPEWRGAGIATFMLYHLIQTCMGKDITLHVSATNPAVILYQKFGFKIEEFVLDFYDKYLPADSQECKHALFLRLSR